MANYRAMARQAAKRHGLDPDIFERQIDTESGFRPDARSPAGATGIAQIMPATARGWHVNPNDPRASLNAAAANMARYVDQFGSYDKALRAYNAGPGNVEKSKDFGETNAYVKKILQGTDPGSSGTGRGGAPGPLFDPAKTTTKTSRRLVSPAVDNEAERAALVYNFLSPGSGSQKDLLGFVGQAQALEDVPAQYATDTKTVTTPGATLPGAGGGGGAGGLAASATERAAAIDAQGLPYRWGGGHGGKTPLNKAIPLDCSGAVSKVLGIDPRVAAQFSKWGRPGDGGNKGVTVYSNPGHVLMKINGHFFGTSRSNPGGGAGWIKQEDVSPEYLQSFTARHSER